MGLDVTCSVYSLFTLPGWDYRPPGAYPATLVTRHREWLSGDVIDDRMVLNEAGVMVDETWANSCYRSPTICPPPISPSVEYGRLSWTQTARRGAMPLGYDILPIASIVFIISN
jgi:hypothetical protein